MVWAHLKRNLKWLSDLLHTFVVVLYMFIQTNKTYSFACSMSAHGYVWKESKVTCYWRIFSKCSLNRMKTHRPDHVVSVLVINLSATYSRRLYYAIEHSPPRYNSKQNFLCKINRKRWIYKKNLFRNKYSNNK